jgi:hypothetical protein
MAPFLLFFSFSATVTLTILNAIACSKLPPRIGSLRNLLVFIPSLLLQYQSDFPVVTSDSEKDRLSQRYIISLLLRIVHQLQRNEWAWRTGPGLACGVQFVFEVAVKVNCPSLCHCSLEDERVKEWSVSDWLFNSTVKVRQQQDSHQHTSGERISAARSYFAIRDIFRGPWLSEENMRNAGLRQNMTAAKSSFMM